MLSVRTKLKLVSIIETYTTAELDRLLIVFGIAVPNDANGNIPSKARKANAVLLKIKENGSVAGPIGRTNEEDFLQYIVDDFYNKHPEIVTPFDDFSFGENVQGNILPNHEDKFSENYSDLANLLKQDGLIIKGNEIRSLLPEELQAAQVETELVRLLRKYNFAISEGHLNQAIQNHTVSNWAGANSQFRTFIESLLMEISRRLSPGSPVTSAHTAIVVLSTTVPPFLADILNEVQGPNSFVPGLWRRLHPEGSHPGLSDEEDCTFRYHICTVFARYLLARLEQRNL